MSKPSKKVLSGLLAVVMVVCSILTNSPITVAASTAEDVAATLSSNFENDVVLNENETDSSNIPATEIEPATPATTAAESGVSTFATLSGSLDEVYLNGVSGDDSNGGSSTSDAVKTFDSAKALLAYGGTIYISGKVTVDTSETWELPDGYIKRESTYTSGTLIDVASSGNLTLQNIIIDDHTMQTYYYNNMCITVSGGELSINSGTVLKNGHRSVHIHNGTFTMNGGEIYDNQSSSVGGIIYINDGSFYMSGGKISGNDGGPAVYIGSDSSFIMSGTAKIYENNYQGVFVASDGLFTMDGGEISGHTSNYAGGVYIDSNGIFNMNGGIISENKGVYGGGVFVSVDGTFNMSGGEISDNTASDRAGGIHLFGGAFNMNGGEISGNTALSGGGIYIAHGTLIMNDGEIFNNTADSGGGGINNNSFGNVIINGGKIFGNSAYIGGGVHRTSSQSTFIMNGGEIYNNHASYYGGGTTGLQEISGDVRIWGNTVNGGIQNTHFPEPITITGTLAPTASIGITWRRDNPVFATVKPGVVGDFSGNFISDDISKVVAQREDNGNQVLELIANPDAINISFDLNGGSGRINSMYVLKGDEYPELPVPPTQSWMTFIGWFTERIGGSEVKAGDSMPTNQTYPIILYAQWTYAELELISPQPIFAAGNSSTAMRQAVTINRLSATQAGFTWSLTGENAHKFALFSDLYTTTPLSSGAVSNTTTVYIGVAEDQTLALDDIANIQIIDGTYTASIAITIITSSDIKGTISYYAEGIKYALNGATVYAYNRNWNYVGSCTTGMDGKYSIVVNPSLQSSNYYICAYDANVVGASKLLLDKEEADIVPNSYRNINAVDATTEANFTFVDAPPITGTIVDLDSGARISNAYVSSYDSTRTDSSGRFRLQANISSLGTLNFNIYAYADGYYSTSETKAGNVTIDSLKNGNMIDIGSLQLQKIATSGPFGDPSKNNLMLVPSIVTSGEISNATLNIYADQNTAINNASITITPDSHDAKIKVSDISGLQVLANGVLVNSKDIKLSGGQDGITITMNIAPRTQYKIMFGVQAPASNKRVTSYVMEARLNGTLIGTQTTIINNLTVTVPPEIGIGDSFRVYGEVTSETDVTVKIAIRNPKKDVVYSKQANSSGLLYKFDSISLPSPITLGKYTVEVSAVNSVGVTIATSSAIISVVDFPVSLQTIKLGDDYNSVSANATPGSFLTFNGWVDGETRSLDYRNLQASITLKNYTNYKSAKFVMKTNQGTFEWAANKNGDALSAYLRSFQGTGKATVSVEITKLDSSIITYTIGYIIILIDPSGYVYDKTTNKRIQGATVTLYYKNDSGKWSIWPAGDYMQVNPQTTDNQGVYGWMVPEGEYEVRVSANGYEDYTSLDAYGIINVLPERKDINPALTPISSAASNNKSKSSGGSSESTISTNNRTSWVRKSEMKTLIKNAQHGGLDYVGTRTSGMFGVHKDVLAALKGLRYRHTTLEQGTVQLRLTISNPEAITKDLLVSGYVKGSSVEQVTIIFNKWFKNRFRVIHFDQEGAWGQPVEVAAKLDFTDFDTQKLYFYYYYDSANNKYKRIDKPSYWFDKNGFLHFTTEFAGDIIISENALEKK